MGQTEIDKMPFLLFAGELLKSLSFQFRIGLSTLTRTIPEVCDAIYNNLKEEFMKVCYQIIANT
jgi:hypothetical protein